MIFKDISGSGNLLKETFVGGNLLKEIFVGGNLRKEIFVGISFPILSCDISTATFQLRHLSRDF